MRTGEPSAVSAWVTCTCCKGEEQQLQLEVSMIVLSQSQKWGARIWVGRFFATSCDAGRVSSIAALVSSTLTMSRSLLAPRGPLNHLAPVVTRAVGSAKPQCHEHTCTHILQAHAACTDIAPDVWGSGCICICVSLSVSGRCVCMYVDVSVRTLTTPGVTWEA